MYKKLLKLGVWLYDRYALQVCLLEGFGTCVLLILDQVLFSMVTETQRTRLEVGLLINIVITVWLIMSKTYTDWHKNWEDQ